MSDFESIPPAPLHWSPPEQLVILAEDDPEILPELIDAFVDDTGLRMNRMLAASKAGDGTRVSIEAHAIKGGASQIGALDVAAICQKLESTAANLTTSEMEKLVAELELLHQAVCQAMAAFLTEYRPAR